MRPFSALPIAGLLAAVLPLAPARGAEDPEGAAFFEGRIRPILVEHCYQCHSARTARPEAGLRLDTREGLRKGGDSGPIVEAGKPGDSLLIRALEYSSENARMPPKGRLADPIIDDFRKWIEQGAPDPR
jgi:hypothetical protein